MSDNIHDDEHNEEVLDERTDAEKEIDKLYSRVENLFAHLYLGNPERVNSLDLILRTLEKINKIQRQEFDSSSEDDMSMQQIYHLAVQGGGVSDEYVAELQEANTLFAEERDALIEAVERLTFQIKAIKNKAADKLIKRGTIKKTNIDAIEEHLEKITERVNLFETSLQELTQDEDAPEGPLSERMMNAIGDEKNPVLALLRSEQGLRSEFSDFLRTRGFAYDHQDVYALQTLIAAQQSILEEFDGLINNMEALANIMDLVHSINGFDERDTNEYTQAMAQIERLQKKFDEFEERQETLKTLDDEIQEKKKEKAALEQEVEALKAAAEQARNQASKPSSNSSQNDQASNSDLEKQLAQKDAKIKELEELIANSKKAQALQKLKDEVQHYKDMLGRTEDKLARNMKELKALKERVPLLLRDTKRLIHQLIPIQGHEDTIQEVLELVKQVGSKKEISLAEELQNMLGKLQDVSRQETEVTTQEKPEDVDGDVAKQIQSLTSRAEKAESNTRRKEAELLDAQDEIDRLKNALEAEKEKNTKPKRGGRLGGLFGGAVSGIIIGCSINIAEPSNSKVLSTSITDNHFFQQVL